MAKARKIKFVVTAKRWFDKVNGNTYHSVRCVRNKDNALIVGPMQYGYDDHYRQTALELMYKAGWLKDSVICLTPPEKNLFRYERENNYPIYWDVSDGLKRDCVRNGEA